MSMSLGGRVGSTVEEVEEGEEAGGWLGLAGSVDGVAGVCGVGVVVELLSAVENGESDDCCCCCEVSVAGCGCAGVQLGLGWKCVSIACTKPSDRRTNLTSFARHHVNVGKLITDVSSGSVVSGLTLQFNRK